jgi:DNA-directed RNA polymerase subunit K/omega
MEKGTDKVNFEKQAFEKMNVNPYEVVIAVSKSARDINDKAQKYLSHDCEINPVRMAMKRLNNSQVQFQYVEPSGKGKKSSGERE